MTNHVRISDGTLLTVDDLCHASGYSGYPCTPEAMRDRLRRSGLANMRVTDEQLGQLVRPAGKPRGRKGGSSHG